MNENRERINDAFCFLYGEDAAGALTEQIMQRITAFKKAHHLQGGYDPAHRVNERDVIMIAYGDMVQEKGVLSLATLTKFASQYLHEMVNTIHILPFFPYSSDDGFSVIDYRQVKPEWGNWDDIHLLSEKFNLMFDVVVNHISQYSHWFQEYLTRHEPYQDYFITMDPSVDLSAVFRPRALPLLTAVNTTDGEKYVWTTFSADQIDLNFANPQVLLEVLNLFLFYIAHGARFIRLDAVAFIWKEIGTSCVHLPQVHTIIELTRAILDEAAPQSVIITETNVPHQENISYFGDGHHEAQMVYNFSLPPLVLHSIQTGSTRCLKQWASTLSLLTSEVTFFNFLASHDGIGLLPARGILTEEEINALAEHTLKMGGRVSYKNNPDGSKSPYEMNINYLDATRPGLEDEPTSLTARRFLATQSVLLVMRGVPGIYYHSLLGSQNWVEGMMASGQNRTINREKLMLKDIQADLSNPATLRCQVFDGYNKLLKVRRNEKSFDPHGEQVILDTPDSVFGAYRCARDADDGIFCLTNFSDLPCSFILSFSSHDIGHRSLWDLLSGDSIPRQDDGYLIQLDAYQTAWYQPN